MSSKKNRNKFSSPTLKGPSKPQPTPVASPAPIQETVTIEDVKDSSTQAEFEDKKDKLFQQLEEEEKLYSKMANDAKESYEKANSDLQQKTDELKKLTEQVEALQRELGGLTDNVDKANQVISDANDQAERTKSDARKKADKITADATIEAAKIKNAAKEEAQKALKELSDDLDKQEKELSKLEETLSKDKKALEKDRKLFKLEQADYETEKAVVERQRELYSKANPARLEEMERQLDERTQAYEALLSTYNEQKQRYVDLQVLTDTIKAEVEDPHSGKHIYSIKELLDKIKELKDEIQKQNNLMEKYPSYDAILQLESRAKEADGLEESLRTASHERDEYRSLYEAEKRLSGELSAIKRELDATRALNEHLLQELGKNKMALENRTGNVCPMLTKVDEEVCLPEYQQAIAIKRKRPQISSLPELVKLIRNYAGNGNSGEYLYYTEQDIRAFLAGMAVSRLMMLQGMSGTGKSSLPRIISKAISGENHLIPVESSWRDRNELLGYYNDFNKLFNAKSFTIELYRSGKEISSDIPTFIVLDEMNLARIEYYFSDFLAILQEPDPEKWSIELVSSDMRTLPTELAPKVEAELKKTEHKDIYDLWMRKKKLRNGDNKVAELSSDEENKLREQLAQLNAMIGAADLIDGRKIRVPQNVWFVGTANEDESTFEISDKVYDRAQVVTLNKKGEDTGDYDPKAQAGFISVVTLQKLFQEARRDNNTADKVRARLDEIDKVLTDKFHVSFGNRIVAQTIDFVAVYVAAGGTLDDALDAQISTKILRKVINSDDAEAFIALQEKCENYPVTYDEIEKKLHRLD